ncbi:hypothetical protein ACFL7D_03245 [candidate division KSB1 bacterium]
MRTCLVVVLLVFFISVYTSSAQTLEEPLRNVLKLELVFGAENLPDEFLLANPGELSVDDAGNIYVIDEKRVKVFDKNGKAIDIFSGPGRGPGEFIGQVGTISISQTGYISVHNGGVFNSRGYNIYDSNYKFLKISHKNKYTMMGFHSGYSAKIYTFGEDEYVGVSKESYTEDDLIKTSEKLEFYKGDIKHEIAAYDKLEAVVTKDMNLGINYNGRFLWDYLPDKSIIYSHSRLDAVFTPEKSYQKLHIIDLQNNEKKILEHSFEPRIIEIKEYREFDRSTSRQMREILNQVTTRKEAYERMHDILRSFKYADYLRRIFADGNIVFIVTTEKNDNEEVLVDVLDCEKMVYLTSVYFPPKTNFRKIKNGFAYKIGESDGFPVVQKYRIDPAVYGK